MNKRTILWPLAALLLLVCGSCTKEVETPVSPPAEGAGTVSFRLGGSAALNAGQGGAASVDQAPELQSAEEKRVDALYAVVFKATDEDVNGCPFYQTIKIELSDGAQPSGELHFWIGNVGDYKVYFVANPDATLAGALEGLTLHQNGADVKRLVAEQAPDSKDAGLLMTSESFHDVTVAAGKVTEMGTVRLQRAMARIDVSNACDGVTITKIVFRNRAEKTLLCRDNGNTAAELLGEKTYEGLGLVGSETTPAEYKGAIYTYEQLFDEASSAKPTLEVHYTMAPDNASHTHTVQFERASDTQGPEGTPSAVPVPLKRNHLYRVKIVNENNSMRFYVGVDPWGSGQDMEVGGGTIGDGLEDGSGTY